MTLGNKLSKLRRENNYTQEQLADILGVSRQSVSKWESDAACPETEKLLRLGELYNCSMDYLLKDGSRYSSDGGKSVTFKLDLNTFSFERKSKKTLWGMPLWHINIGFGRKAKGIIAIGFGACGVISVGMFSAGIVSLGLCSVGAIALGVLSLGLLSLGTLALGVIALGAVAVGIISAGAVSVGAFSFGALAMGKYFALGDTAKAMISLGRTNTSGSVYESLGTFGSDEYMAARCCLEHMDIPFYLSWARKIVMLFL